MLLGHFRESLRKPFIKALIFWQTPEERRRMRMDLELVSVSRRFDRIRTERRLRLDLRRKALTDTL